MADITLIREVGRVERGGRKNVSWRVAEKALGDDVYIDLRKHEGEQFTRQGAFLKPEEVAALLPILAEAAGLNVKITKARSSAA